MTAELLGIPCVTAISHLEIRTGKGTAGASSKARPRR